MNSVREALLNILLLRQAPLRIRKELETLEYSQAQIENELRAGLPKDVRHAEIGRWRRVFANWDNAEGAWTNNSLPRSEERRNLILRRLDIAGTVLLECLSDRSNIPLNEPRIDLAVISGDPKHEDWYSAGVETGYWGAYKHHLENRKSWDANALDRLDVTTTRILNHLANPRNGELRRTKGLVVGYVQSGKTASYSALIAKAVDAGYGLVIVLSGRTDILRNQTQARLDMELMGWESLDSKEKQEYQDKSAREGQSYEEKFVHNRSGSLRFLRLTKTDSDFNSGSIALHEAGVPYIAVLKKNPKRLDEFAKMLGGSEWRRRPVLLIDDEADDASVNTSKSNITPTAGLIAKIMDSSDCSQYVGYTATPYANVFIHPERAKELFPSDFVICLDRPEHYMGALELYDIGDTNLSGEVEDLKLSNEQAYIRVIKEDFVSDANPLADLPRLTEAVDSFVLAGGIKKWREANCGMRFKHHTMLINTDRLTEAHSLMAGDIERLLEVRFAGKRLTSGIESRLEQLWESDFKPVLLARTPDEKLFPSRWTDLSPFVAETIERIANQRVLIVNCENKDDTPDFEESAGCWAILVGGAKLSRGYTIEGLTTSYFIRKPGQLDTLLQMARWYGFRKHYSDLVRLYIPETLPRSGSARVASRRRKRTVENKYRLLDAFRFGARVEEAFRGNLYHYSMDLRPQDIPPLVQYEFSDFPHDFRYLRPTASNKMRNASFETHFLGGVIKTVTRIGGESSRAQNGQQLSRLLDSCTESVALRELRFIGLSRSRETVLTGVTNSECYLEFMRSIRYTDKTTDDVPRVIRDQLDALSRMDSIRWRVIMFMPEEPSVPLQLASHQLPHWTRDYDVRDGVLTYDKPLHPPHKKIAAWLAAHDDGVGIESDDPDTLALRDANGGVIYVVPFTRKENRDSNAGFSFLWCAVYPGKGRVGAFKVVRQQGSPPVSS